MTKRRHRRAGWEAARLGRCADGRRLTARPKVRGGRETEAAGLGTPGWVGGWTVGSR
jgi:hypothetical protein